MLLTRAAGTSMLAALAAALLSTSALAQHLDPLPGKATHAGPYAPPYVAPPRVKSGTWTAVKGGFPGTSFPDTAELMTDGGLPAGVASVRRDRTKAVWSEKGCQKGVDLP